MCENTQSFGERRLNEVSVQRKGFGGIRRRGFKIKHVRSQAEEDQICAQGSQLCQPVTKPVKHDYFKCVNEI